MRFVIAAALLTVSLAPTAAVIQAAPAQTTISEGMKVVDGNGTDVGTVVKVDGDMITVKTKKHEAALLRTSITPDGDRLLLAMTQQQLNEAVERSLAGEPAKLVAGTMVLGSDGVPVGTIDIGAVAGGYIPVKLLSGKKIQFPVAEMSARPKGGVLDMTAEQLKALFGR